MKIVRSAVPVLLMAAFTVGMTYVSDQRPPIQSLKYDSITFTLPDSDALLGAWFNINGFVVCQSGGASWRARPSPGGGFMCETADAPRWWRP